MNILTERELFILLVNNEPLRPADAIVILEGDGGNRLAHAAQLFKKGLAPKIVFSGGILQLEYGSFPFEYLKEDLLKLGVPESSIILERISQNTREQAIEVMKLAKLHGWIRIILVASHYHQFRAFLTFLRAKTELDAQTEIVNSPVQNLSWQEETGWGRRIDLVEGEFERIERYRRMGHLATFAEGIQYQLSKEAQHKA